MIKDIRKYYNRILGEKLNIRNRFIRDFKSGV